MIEIMIKVILGVVLLLCAIQDVIKKKIQLWMAILAAILILICLPFCNPYSIPDRIGGVAVGVSVVIISKVTEGKIGMGDGILLCVTGLGLGFWGNLELFAVALFAAAVIAMILLTFHLVNRKKSIPFVPFLLFGYLFLTVITVGT